MRENEPVFYPDNLREISTKLIPVIRELAGKYGKTTAQIALNWLIMHDNVVPIPGAKSAAQVVENAGAAGWRLSEDDFRRLTEASNSLVITYVTW
uniref:aldo/keto reductase n=1 Tax=Vulcanisaeta sp. JCM 14467 TaxID=1295370 RepID=UPI000B2D14D9|nr:aldo/keto reductase [Vulcanisaeta sp. JCM 14467]